MIGTVDLRALLLAKQEMLRSELAAASVHWHPDAKGDVGEVNWQAVLDGRHGRNGFLPNRYAVTSAFIIDADGNRSEQIDLVIHDAHFCPLLFEQAGHRYIPAESVYAVFEVKPELNRDYVMYAAKKAASVRALRRTSVAVVDVGKQRPPREPFRILAGLLTARAGWADPLGASLTDALNDCEEAGRIDLGIIADGASFEADYGPAGVSLDVSEPDGGLMFFLTRLFTRLQRMGTVTAADLNAYSRRLQDVEASG
jgi:hypothetical protein